MILVMFNFHMFHASCFRTRKWCT